MVPDLLAGHVKSRSELLSRVKDELVQEHWNLKNNDLYYFRQTNGIASGKTDCLVGVAVCCHLFVFTWAPPAAIA